MKNGKMIILSGPSGSGKTTISEYLLSKIPKLKFSVSCTTRSIRNNEKHGKDYYFISTNKFISKIKKNQFLEWEEVYPKLFYGTLKSEISRIWNEHKHVLFDVDVKGGLCLQKQYPYDSLSIFIMVNSMEILKRRLFSRNHEELSQINIRLNKAKMEWKYAKLFDIVLLNINLSQTQKKVIKLVYNFTENRG
ncbi:guanylate kinase [Blattabacterium sp. (Cryptocercus kyebangensis)]|uniref:guanylate kinase n=1 Tax=Blattabacterium sp. (Cryptocercus kyebangensis) TaxID=298656 RepID=UPI000D7C1508|nr:guanylate kinase [Blattabacterium sp. (Cryptocercus kyebangensis)]AWU43723.1 guanylate kinase [Blattabacterium sp. (Cryptocercus kyebangensis)]